jgi:hypothetical protein
MSEAIKNTFVSFAICSVVGGVLEYLTPPKYRKTLRVAAVGIVLALCIMPIFNKDFEFDIKLKTESQSEQLSYDSLMHTANLVEKTVRSQIKEVLINHGVDEYEIYITTSVDKEKNVVYLEEITVEVHEKYKDKLNAITKALPQDYRDIVKTGVKNE